ncbi:MAG: hypothetical protein H0X38_17475, partial [Planctomycetes bacterium]|nr:hypothetical protein [Planctomycetota bacterium]
SGAAHAGLAADAREWLPFDLAEYALAVADRRNRLEIAFTQPEGGKATVVIEDAVSGRRLRNLVGGQPFAAGAQRVAWDGLDDHAAVVPPGTYRWRSLHHPGIVPEYAMSFANGDDTLAQLSGWGPNHTVLDAATASDAWTVVSAPMTEGGDAILVLDAQGRKVRGMNVPLGMGIAHTASAISGDTLYVANDGPAFLDHIDERDAHAVAHLRITLARFDLAQGRLLEWKSGGSFIAVAEAATHPADDPEWRSAGLAGLAALGDRLYLADRRGGRLLVLDAATGAQSGVFALPALAGLTSAQGRLYALVAGAVVTVDTQSGAATTLVEAAATRQPVALAVDAGGRIYVSDAASHTVLVFDTRGQPLGALGRPGGPYTGAFDHERMVNPRGLAVAANGWLWVTEERGAPKRIVAWDTSTRRVVCEKFGSPPYGGTGAGVDPVDPTRWIGLGAQWRIDLATRSAQPIAIVGPDHHEFHYSYVRDHGVTYLIGYGQATTIARVNADGSATPVALIASAHRFSFACDWQPPEAFVTAFAAAYPGRAGKHADKGPGFVWSDANGDGVMQPGEFDFATSAESFAGAYFGHDQHDLTLRVPVTVGGRRVVVALAPSGFTATDAPRYPSLPAACSAGVPIDLAGNEVETTVDRFGDLICNAEPELKAFAPDGRLLWTHPNRWVGVHGSHDAPLPETGVMQGALGFMGTAPLDATSDVFVMNGNHGRYFMLTSDGLYVDEFFKDVRMGAHLDTTLVGGEAFGGCFARGERDGIYYLQVGGYRVYRMRGLDRLQRGQGVITVSPAQAIAAERAMAAHGAIAAKPHAAVIPLIAQAPALPG